MEPPRSRAVDYYAGLRRISWIALAIWLGCAPPADYALVGSAYVPSAHGDIAIEKIDREQIMVEVTLDHLPAPEEVQAGMTYYIVWFAEVGEPPVRKRALDYDGETRVGKTTIATSLLEFDVLVTAEASAGPTEPSDI